MPNEAPPGWRPRTIAAQALGLVEPTTKAVVPPLHMATTFVRDPDNQYRAGYVYGRPDNATARQAEAVLAALEEAHEAALFGSGMAAATASCWRCRRARTSSRRKVMYWASAQLAHDEAPRFGYRVDFVDRPTSPRVRGGGEAGRDQARLDRDAGQSAVGHHRHRGGRRDRARGRRACSPSIRRWRRRC